MVIILLGGLGLCAIFLLYMVIEAHRNIILRQTIKCPNLPHPFNGFTLYFISDIHRRKLSRRMLKRIDGLDIVIIGGDIMERGVPFSRVGENLRRLSELRVPLFFVWGNHDLHVNRDMLIYLLNKYHVIRLENDAYVMHRNSKTFNILGVEDATNDLDDLDAALSRAKPGFRLLISHNPVITNKIKSYHDIPLVISGHTHGGQIRLLGWGIRESGGIKTKPFGKLVISCGYGTTRFPLRFGAPPDTLLIKLKSE